MNAAEYKAEIAANDEEYDAERKQTRNRHRDTVRTLRSRMTSLTKTVSNLASELLEENARREEQRLRIVELKSQLEAADDLRGTSWGLMEQLRLQLNNVKQELEEANAENIGLSAAVLSERAARDAVRFDLAIAEEDARQEKERLEEQMRGLRGELNVTEAERDAAREELAEMNEELALRDIDLALGD